MNIFFIVLFVCVYNADALRFYRGHLVGYDIPQRPVATRKETNISLEYFTQRLDHYDPTNKALFSQRYYVNTEYMNTEKNVALLFIGGESEASPYWLSYGSCNEIAEEHGAILFSLEHRFFGESQPFSDLSTEHLRYLTSRQALNDLATFISAMNQQYKLAENVKWIVYGGSYAGALAAWLRQKYPHLVHGAVASSGPLFAKLDFPEYLQVVIDDLALNSQECVDNLQEAIKQLDDLIQNPGDEDLNSLFSLCDDIAESAGNPLDLAYLFELIADVFAGVAQYNDPTSTTYSIDIVCNILNDESKGREVQRLAQVYNLVEGFGAGTCLDYRYDKMIEKWRNDTMSTTGMIRQWLYMTCTEFGYYQTSSQKVHVFGNRFPVSFFTRQCADIFGEKFNETFVGDRVNRTNIFYGGYNIETSNVVFVYGTVDPWHVLGVYKTVNPATPAILINGTSHCADLYAASSTDSAELTAARKEIKKVVNTWLES